MFKWLFTKRFRVLSLWVESDGSTRFGDLRFRKGKDAYQYYEDMEQAIKTCNAPYCIFHRRPYPRQVGLYEDGMCRIRFPMFPAHPTEIDKAMILDEYNKLKPTAAQWQKLK
jgi:hypothetical protein